MSGAVPEIALIWAQARGGVIGADGAMPWHLPEDLRHFSATTAGAPVVMGRRTWESFPPRFRPLPGRTNVVITRDAAVAEAGAVHARSLDEALRLAAAELEPRRDDDTADCPTVAHPTAPATVWVIGGGGVYREALPRADRLVVTEIDLEVAGDTTAPAVPEDFALTAADPAEGWRTAASGLRYRMLNYGRSAIR